MLTTFVFGMYVFLTYFIFDQFFIKQKVKWKSSLPFGGPCGGIPGVGGIPIVGGTPIGGKPNGGCGPCCGGGCWGCGGGWGLRTSILHVGHVCCLWNHDRKQLVWNMWLQGSFLQPVVISSRHMMHTLSPCWSSSGVASGYLMGSKRTFQQTKNCLVQRRGLYYCQRKSKRQPHPAELETVWISLAQRKCMLVFVFLSNDFSGFLSIRQVNMKSCLP